MIELHNPDMPTRAKWIALRTTDQATILVPDEYLGDVLKLCWTGAASNRISPMRSRAMIVYDLPLNEVV